MSTITPEATVAELNQKIDRLTAQVEFLTEEALAAARRRREWEELKSDFTPLLGEMYTFAARELEEIDHGVTLEQITHLLKRLVRNAPMLERMLDQLESVQALFGDLGPLTGNAVDKLMTTLDDFEQRGYFAFAKEAITMADNVVTSFTPEDVRALGDNIVLILQTVREMTQPEVMTMLRRTASSAREQDLEEDISLLSLLKQMRDPAVKKGLARALGTLRSISGEPQEPV
jgi:uncharacterized protein YjgD (DUF1641 family)